MNGKSFKSKIRFLIQSRISTLATARAVRRESNSEAVLRDEHAAHTEQDDARRKHADIHLNYKTVTICNNWTHEHPQTKD